MLDVEHKIEWREITCSKHEHPLFDIRTPLTFKEQKMKKSALGVVTSQLAVYKYLLPNIEGWFNTSNEFLASGEHPTSRQHQFVFLIPNSRTYILFFQTC